MKKRLILSAVMVAIIITSGISLAAKEKANKEPKVKKKTPAKPDSQINELRKKMPRTRRARPNSPEDRIKLLQKNQEKKIENAKKGPLETIRDLKAIKKIAEKEKAKNTVKAIDALIAKTKKKMEKRVEALEKSQADMKKRIEQRRNRTVKPKNTDALKATDKPRRPRRPRKPNKTTGAVIGKPADKN